MSTNDEIFPVVEPDGRVVGKATRGECHGGSMLLHPVVHLHVVGPDHTLYLQKRAMTKDIQPGKWDTAVGGHVDFGESVDEALRREAREELVLTDFESCALPPYDFCSERESEL
ncbi:NUDIX domain-containing protein, partial [Muribaculum sp.]|uniref:NUDIX hydrolase n=1 Tax=Muribaculum sp. TaxID=1918611 RepID=UPI0023CF7447